MAALPPVPPIPTYDTLMRQKSGETWQQKIFLGDVQRSTVVEVGTNTSAQDVIDTIESRGEIGPNDPNNNGGKGWMLFELAQDFGMGTFFSQRGHASVKREHSQSGRFVVLRFLRTLKPLGVKKKLSIPSYSSGPL